MKGLFIMSVEPNPINPISWLVIFLLGLIGFFLYASVPASSTVQMLPDTAADHPARPSVAQPPVDGLVPLSANAEYLTVDTIDVTIRESAPPQVSVDISGYWSNGCSAEPQIDKIVEGNHITLMVYRTLPADVMCTMVIQAAELQIDIADLLVQNGVRSGQFSVTVNGVTIDTRF